jgi:hypothetical protein
MGQGLDDSTGGLQQQQLPGMSKRPRRVVDRRQLDLLDPDQDDIVPAIDQRALDQAGRLSTAARGHAINAGSDRDLLPGF